MKLRVVDVRKPAELKPAFEAMRRDQADALVLIADPFLFSERSLILQLAAQHRMPAVYEHRRFPENGGLLSYGPFYEDRFQRMAAYVDRILRGARPGELPVERPTKFDRPDDPAGVAAAGGPGHRVVVGWREVLGAAPHPALSPLRGRGWFLFG
jgi:ABC-type uncharacterized transport system substrate-binding protein